MAEIKLILGIKEGKSFKKILTEKESQSLYGLKIGSKIKGENIGLSGYELEITGGSDKDGFPMRAGVNIPGKTKILAVAGTGVKKKGHGIYQRKTVAGSIISDRTSQVNAKITTYGKKTLQEILGIAEKKEETPKIA